MGFPLKTVLLRLVQGFIIGAGGILPGISGGVLSVIFGIYRPVMEVLAHPLNGLRRHLSLLLPVGAGAILGFLCAWAIPNTVFSCLHIRYAASWCRDGHEGLFTFLRAIYIFLFIPLLVLFLHWLFGWSPVQLWVWIVLGAYTLLALIGSFSYARKV